MKKIQAFITIGSTGLILFACVPARQFEDLQGREKQCRIENDSLRSQNQDLKTSNTELSSKLSELQKSADALVKDTTEQGLSYRRLTSLYSELNNSYEKLLSNNEKLLAGNTEETKRLIAQLNQVREDLQKKEDQLSRDSIALVQREKSVNDLRESLKEKEARVNELQGVLDRMDSTVKNLKESVSKALLGYQGNGLSVNQKNGRVYVSMEERLLFASGSTNVEKKGEEALHDLARVLEKNPDINVTVEGHTDDVPISGTLPSGARDNWELSVLRATSVVKIILKDSDINPIRLTAAGKGPYQPVDPAKTAEARKKNRRTEIILAPQLDELMKLISSVH